MKKEEILKKHGIINGYSLHSRTETTFKEVLSAMQEYAEAYHKERGEGVSGSLPSDTKMLNWIEHIMTPKENYCEVFFAGLRNGDADATEFQIECNPERFKVMHAKSLREVILLAMQKYPKAR